jgi:preprotein translocase subunit SecE
MKKIMNFINSIFNEFKQVDWPNKKQITVLSVSVVFISILVSLYIGTIDLLFTSLLKKIGIL